MIVATHTLFHVANWILLNLYDSNHKHAFSLWDLFFFWIICYSFHTLIVATIGSQCSFGIQLHWTATNVHIDFACLPLGLYNHVANRMWTQCLLPQCRYDSVANWLHNMATTFAYQLCQMPYHVCCHIMSVAMLQSVQCGIFIVLQTQFFRFATMSFVISEHTVPVFRLSIQMWFHCFFVLYWANMATSTFCFQVH